MKVKTLITSVKCHELLLFRNYRGGELATRVNTFSNKMIGRVHRHLIGSKDNKSSLFASPSASCYVTVTLVTASHVHTILGPDAATDVGWWEVDTASAADLGAN